MQQYNLTLDEFIKLFGEWAMAAKRPLTQEKKKAKFDNYIDT